MIILLEENFMGVIMKNSVEYGVNGGVTDVMLNNSSIVGGV